MQELRNFFIVGIGSAAGGMLRYAGTFLIRHHSFPLATLCINLLGSFIIGLVFGAAQRGSWLGGAQWLLLATGVCGGFTTFSSFSLENIRLLQNGQVGMALLYIGVSLFAGIAFCWLGIRITD